MKKHFRTAAVLGLFAPIFASALMIRNSPPIQVRQENISYRAMNEKFDAPRAGLWKPTVERVDIVYSADRFEMNALIWDSCEYKNHPEKFVVVRRKGANGKSAYHDDLYIKQHLIDSQPFCWMHVHVNGGPRSEQPGSPFVNNISTRAEGDY